LRDKLVLIKNRTVFDLFFLIVTNVLTHYLFLFQYKFYSDDWPQLVFVNSFDTTYIFGTDRPVMYFLLNTQAVLFGKNPLPSHICALFATSIFLVLLYFILQRITSEFKIEYRLFPFFSCLLFCVLINKDEVYSWPSISVANHFAYLLFLLSVYLFLNNDKERNFWLSALCYTVGIFTYEVGVALPLFFLGYSVLFRKKYAKTFVYLVPLAFYSFLRFTHFAGFGLTGSRGFGDSGILIRIFTSPLIIYDQTIIRIKYGILGLLKLDQVTLIFLIILNCLLVLLLWWYISGEKKGTFTSSQGKALIAISLMFILIFAFPLLVHGYSLLSKDTRLYYLVDIGIGIGVIYAISLVQRKNYSNLVLILLIGFLLFINQGLSYNWVISGNFQEKMDSFISDNKDLLSGYDYYYFNSTSFRENIPNQIDPHEMIPFSDIIPYDTILSRIKGDEFLLSNYFFDDTTFGYFNYYNAKAMDILPLKTMLNAHMRKDNYTLFYSKYQEMRSYITGDNLSTYFYYDRELKENRTLSKDQVFEFNYSNVFSKEHIPKIT